MELVEGVDFLSFVRSGTEQTAPLPQMSDDLRNLPSPSLPGAQGSTQSALGDTEPFDLKQVEERAPAFRAHRGFSPIAGLSWPRLRIALLQL